MSFCCTRPTDETRSCSGRIQDNAAGYFGKTKGNQSKEVPNCRLDDELEACICMRLSGSQLVDTDTLVLLGLSCVL